jgi:hypothetical protein
MAKRDILWPCHAFGVTFPGKKERRYNVFEEAVLKLTAIEPGGTAKIAERTCLGEELVAFIQNRLLHLGFLSERYELSDEGKALLKELEEDEGANLEHMAATVFVDIHSGKILPYITTSELEYERVDSFGGRHVRFSLDTTGRSREIVAFRIAPTEKSFLKKVPAPHEVGRVIKEYRRRYRKRALLLSMEGEENPLSMVPHAEAITVQSIPELVYLHCKIFVAKGSGQILVSDGFGTGFSEVFAQHLKLHAKELILSLKKGSLVTKFVEDPSQFPEPDNFEEGEADYSGAASSPPDLSPKKPRFLYLYPEVSWRFSEIEKKAERIRNATVRSTGEEASLRGERERIITYMYAALEWSLRYLLAQNFPERWEKLFQNSHYRDNAKILSTLAQERGFLLDSRSETFLSVKSGAFRRVQNGSVEMQPLVALALIASIGNEAHPIWNLARKHRDFVSFVLRLKDLRDPLEHGNSEELSLRTENIEALREYFCSVIAILLPAIVHEVDLQESAWSRESSEVDQERLEAEIQLADFFGLAFLSQSSEDLKEQLLRAELFSKDLRGDAAQMEFVKCLASAMQFILLEALKRQDEIAGTGDSIKDIALEKMVEAGFFPEKAAIPQEIVTVNPQRVLRAARGSCRETLGANLLAFCAAASKDILEEIREGDPQRILTVAHVLSLRGHGNVWKSQEESALRNLKKDVFSMIKNVGEI